jgi:hypothetical protein
MGLYHFKPAKLQKIMDIKQSFVLLLHSSASLNHSLALSICRYTFSKWRYILPEWRFIFLKWRLKFVWYIPKLSLVYTK